MKYSLRSSFSRLSLTWLAAAVIQAALGRLLSVMPTSITCQTMRDCGLLSALKWLPMAHFLAAALVGILALWTTSVAWRDHRRHRIVLPLATISIVLFFGQALVGGVLLARARPAHLVILHAASALALWISLGGLALVAGTTTGDPRGRKHVPSRRAADFLALSKPLIVALLLLTTFAGLVVGIRGWPTASLAFWTLLGGALAAGGSSALNQYIDRDLDRHMQRTARRPLAEGRLSPAEGLAFGLALCLASYYVLASFVNFLAALLSLVGIIYYAVLYSVLLKKATVQNIVIGGGAGAIPPMVGWAAATGNLGPPAWILFLIVFLWTPPHFWALALVRRQDYQRAGVPMLPVVRGELATRKQIWGYTIVLVAASLLLPLLGIAGTAYLTAAVLLGILLLYAALAVRRDGGNRLAWRMYRWSSMYLAFLFLAMIVDAVAFRAL